MDNDLVTGILGTIVIWLTSGLLAIVFGFLLTFGLLSKSQLIRYVSSWIVNLSRGIPTSIYIIFGGLLALKFSLEFSLPGIFPGTVDGLEPIAWAIAIALAFGSAGHLAKIFIASYSTLDKSTIDQMNVMGIHGLKKLRIGIQECAYIALPSVSNRMIHHLHNTAFASLFPVVEIFGSIQTKVNESFKVFYFILIGCVIYIVLSSIIWTVFRILEAQMVPQGKLAIFQWGKS